MVYHVGRLFLYSKKIRIVKKEKNYMFNGEKRIEYLKIKRKVVEVKKKFLQQLENLIVL
jgi:hypothetical protein